MSQGICYTGGFHLNGAGSFNDAVAFYSCFGFGGHYGGGHVAFYIYQADMNAADSLGGYGIGLGSIGVVNLDRGGVYISAGSINIGLVVACRRGKQSGQSQRDQSHTVGFLSNLSGGQTLAVYDYLYGTGAIVGSADAGAVNIGVVGGIGNSCSYI